MARVIIVVDTVSVDQACISTQSIKLLRRVRTGVCYWTRSGSEDSWTKSPSKPLPDINVMPELATWREKTTQLHGNAESSLGASTASQT
eukprot:2372713-Amphidinium_carterae.1